jgi:hypothetical protein
MKIPKKVRIGGVDYEVKYEERLNDGSQLAYGHIDFDTMFIRLAPKLQTQQGEHITLLHEIMHGIVHDRGINFKEYDEETIVNQLAKGFYQMLKDNPDIFK